MMTELVQKRPSHHRQTCCYEIIVEGCLDEQWVDWFDGLTMATRDNSTTQLFGSVTDQAALHGLLNRIRDLGLPLVSLQRIQM